MDKRFILAILLALVAGLLILSINYDSKEYEKWEYTKTDMKTLFEFCGLEYTLDK